MLSRRRDVHRSPLAATAGRRGPAPVLALLTAVLALALLRLGSLPHTRQGEDPSLGPDRPPALLGLYGGEVTALHRAGQRLYAGIGGRLAVFAIGADHTLSLLGQSGALSERIHAIAIDQGHAYLAAGSAGLLALDLADEGAPRLVGRVATPHGFGQAGSAYDLAIGDHRAFVASDRFLRVVDLAEPGAPVEVGSLAVGGQGPGAVAVWQGHAYILTGGLLAVVDASRPDRLRLDTWLQPAPGAHWTDLAQREGWLYLAGADLQVFDLSRPDRPRARSRLPLGEPYRQESRLALSGPRLLIEGNRSAGPNLMLIDVSDPAAPRELRQLSGPGPVNDLVEAVDLDYWYTAHSTTGLLGLDLSDPRAAEARQVSLVPSFGLDRAVISGSLAVAIALDYGARSSRTTVIDLHDDASWPIHRGPDISQVVSQVAIHGDTVYLAGWAGLERLHLDRTTQSLDHLGVDKAIRVEAIVVQDDRAYTLSRIQDKAFQVFDLSSRASPRLLGSLKIEFVGTWPTRLLLQVVGDRAYVVSDRGLSVIDVANPSVPRLLGHCDTVGSFPGSGSPSTVQGLAVSGDRVAVGLDHYGISWLDVSDPRSPREISSIKLELPGGEGAASALQPVFIGRRLLTSFSRQNWSNGFGLAWVTVDSDDRPARPDLFWTSPWAPLTDFGRNGERLLLADSHRGLAVWRLDESSPPTFTPPVRPTPSLRPLPTDAERPHQAFLPILSRPSPKTPAGDTGRLRELAVLGGRPEAIAIAGKLLYLGVGAYVETYDISVPGQARRLGSSTPVQGRIVRLALGSDRLFALSRPAFDWAEPPRSDEIPPWTLLSVFDISVTASPILLGETTPILGRTERGFRMNLYATDLAAHGRTVYMTVFERSSMQADWGSFPGLAIIDATSVPLRYSVAPDLVGRGFRPLVHDGRLYIKGDLPADRAAELGFNQGVMGFDLSAPLAPRWLGAAGNIRLDNSVAVFNLVGQGKHLYHVHDAGYLLPIEIQEDGQPELMGDWREDEAAMSLQLGLELSGVKRSAAAPGRLYLLLPRMGDTPIASIDIRDPMHPVRLPWFGIGGLNLQWGEAPMEARDMKPDLGSDLAATTDGRLFLASGHDGVLVELDVRNPEDQHELARYGARARSDCSLIAGGHLVQVDLSSGILSLRDLADPSQLALVGSTTVKLGSSCTLAKVGPWLYAAGSTGLTVIDIQDPAAPRPRGSLPLGGEPRQLVVDGGSLYLAAGSEGLWTVDVSRPDAPAVLGHMATPGYSSGLVADSDRLYLADGPAGLTVVDVADPTSPREVEALLPGEEIVAIARRGDWFYASGVHRSQPGAGVYLAELITLHRSGPLRVQSRWPLDGGSEGNQALDAGTGTDLYVQDGAGGIRWLDVSAGLPQSRDLLASDTTLTGLVAGEGWVLSSGESQRLLRRDGP